MRKFVLNCEESGLIRGGSYIIREIADSPDPKLPDTALLDTAGPKKLANPG